ncbi:MAG: hypothetical protein IJY26_03555 [Clostridia bacterium]|nr:hypothetical protein [Clostridia bacterium]
MLDKRTAFLLQKINVLCADGNYKILEKDELLSAFPDHLAQSEEGLDGMLAYLQEHEYVDIKYADKERGVYCLYPLPAGRLYHEKTSERRAEAVSSFKKFLFTAFFAAFLGAFFGAGIVAVLTAIMG